MSDIFKFAFVLLILVVGAVGINAAINESARYPTSVVNESVTVNYSSPTLVDRSGDVYGLFYDNETVRNQTGAVLTDGTDYDWNRTTGAITWFNTASTTDGETATITYWFDEPSPEGQALSAVLWPAFIGAGLAGVLFAGFVLVGYLSRLLSPGSGGGSR